MKTYSFRMMDGSTVPIRAATPEEARAKAREYQANLTAGKVERGWDAGRMASLAGRAGVEGLVEGAGTMASLPADIAYNVGVAGTKGFDYLTGRDSGFEFGMPVTNLVTGVADRAADALSFPEAETDNEKLAMAIGKGAVSAIPGLGIGGALRAGGSALRGAGDLLAAAPYTQLAAGAAGSGAAEYTMQNTGNPLLAGAAGLAAGGVTAGGMSAASAANVLARPLHSRGRDQIVGDVLNMTATDPRRAAQNLRNVREIVPGSQPLSGVASSDPGLINMQRTVERMDPQRRFAENIEQANNARHQELRRVTMTPQQVDAASAARTAKADIDTAALFDTPQMKQARVPINDLIRDLNSIKADKRTFARLPVQEALNAAKTQILKNAKMNKDTGYFEINPGVLYSVRQNLAEAMSGKIRSDDLPNIKLAGATGRKIIDLVDNKIETAAKGFKAYMADLAKSGEARSQGSAGYEIYQRGVSRGPGGVTIDEPFLNLASLRKAFVDRQDELSPEQQKTFQRVIDDLERSSKVNSQSVRSAGSDTMQNLSVAAAIGRIAGGGAVDNAISEGIQQLVSRLPIVGTRMGESATADRMVEAMLDPRLAAALMRRATPGNIAYANTIAHQIFTGGVQGGRSSAAAAQNWVVEDAQGNRYDAQGRLVQ